MLRPSYDVTRRVGGLGPQHQGKTDCDRTRENRFPKREARHHASNGLSTAPFSTFFVTNTCVLPSPRIGYDLFPRGTGTKVLTVTVPSKHRFYPAAWPSRSHMVPSPAPAALVLFLFVPVQWVAPTQFEAQTPRAGCDPSKGVTTVGARVGWECHG